jgi:putative transposase
LDAEVFYNVADARIKLSMFRHYYNQERPHSALGHVPPAQFAQQIKNHGG